MRRHVVSASLLLLAIGLLAGCGQKGPLTLPPAKPSATPPVPAASAAKPAPVASPAAPVTARGG